MTTHFFNQPPILKPIIQFFSQHAITLPLFPPFPLLYFIILSPLKLIPHTLLHLPLLFFPKDPQRHNLNKIPIPS
ncbi:DUF5366 family protein, partial [Bacillus pumilus]|uniref:DUF5366 family protein n=1 Tax=Bacillus pumilus TaxID=1408 RepID=UPI0021B3AE3F